MGLAGTCSRPPGPRKMAQGLSSDLQEMGTLCSTQSVMVLPTLQTPKSNETHAWGVPSVCWTPTHLFLPSLVLP